MSHKRLMHLSFANGGLPYFVGGEIAEQDSLLVQTPASLKARFNLDVRINTEVVRLDPESNASTALSTLDPERHRHLLFSGASRSDPCPSSPKRRPA